MTPASMKIEGGRRIRAGNIGSVREAPLVSIITVVRNGDLQLADTIESVLSQPGDDYELLVVDGASKDATLDIVRKYDDSIEYWLSEPDRGIYDAINKAVHAARGRFLYHLNLGDTLIRIPTRELQCCLKDGTVIAGFRVLIDHRDVFVPRNDWKLRLTNTLHHQGTFYLREAFIKYDTDFRVFADYDVNQRMILRGDKVTLFDTLIANHSTDGLSHFPCRAQSSLAANTAAESRSASGATFKEVFRIIRKNYGPAYVVASYLYFKMRGLRKRIRSVWSRLPW
jgi:glycosyltransferase involved in cell wall biosynthesis